MIKEAKRYRDNVVRCLINKYHMKEFEAFKVVKNSFLNESLEKYPEETMHDDIESNSDIVYKEYIKQ